VPHRDTPSTPERVWGKRFGTPAQLERGYKRHATLSADWKRCRNRQSGDDRHAYRRPPPRGIPVAGKDACIQGMVKA